MLQIKDKIFEPFAGGRCDFRVNAASGQAKKPCWKQKLAKKGRWPTCLRVMRTHHQGWKRGATSHLQHLRDLQEATASKPRFKSIIELIQLKSLSAHATDFPPGQKSFAREFQKSSRRFPGHGAPVSSASPALQALRVLRLTH